MRVRSPLQSAPRTWRASATLALCAALLGACVDPEADYDAFARRPFTQVEAGAGGRTQTPCGKLLASDLSGTYYTSCLPSDLQIPFGLVAEQTIKVDAAGTATLQLSLTPLLTDATDITQTAGEPTVLPPTPIGESCTYDQAVGSLTLPTHATAIARDLVVDDLRLRGRLLEPSLSCALLSGTVPFLGLTLNKDRDVCVFIRLGPADALPMLSVATDYACDPSGLPTLD